MISKTTEEKVIFRTLHIICIVTYCPCGSRKNKIVLFILGLLITDPDWRGALKDSYILF